MAGASIAIETRWEDDEIRRAFQRLQRAGADMQRPLRDFGESWLNSTRARFESQESPSGTPWVLGTVTETLLPSGFRRPRSPSARR